MGNEVEQLMEMGFSRNRAEKALAKTQFRGVEPAMDWLLAHADDPDIDEPYEAPKGHTLGSSSTETKADEGATPMETEGNQAPAEGETAAAPPQAMSLKCEDCGKLLKSELDAQAHAARSGHANFSESTEEIKPLTEEEKAEQLKKLQERLKERRAEKEEQEKKEAIKREKARRTQGKEMVDAKAKYDELQMKKLADQRRREKEEDRIAKQKIREEIEKDKRDRAARFAKQSPAPAAAAPAATAAAPAAAAAPKKDYDSCRLQIRLTNGQALTHSFGSKEELAAVRLYIEMNRTDGHGPFSLMTSFPRKVFTEQDMEKPLFDLGLVPSAVLIVTKS